LAAGAKTSYGDFGPSETPAGRIVTGPFRRRRARAVMPSHPADGTTRPPQSPRALAASEVRPEDRWRRPERGAEAQGSLGRSTGSALCTKAFAGPTGSTARLRPRGQTPGAAASASDEAGEKVRRARWRNGRWVRDADQQGAVTRGRGSTLRRDIGESHERRRDRQAPARPREQPDSEPGTRAEQERRPRMTRSGGVSHVT